MLYRAHHANNNICGTKTNKQTSSALSMHHLNTGHKIGFESTRQIAKIENQKICFIRETIELEKNWKLNKRDDSLSLPAVWKAVLKKHRKAHYITKIGNTPIHRMSNGEIAPTNQEAARYNLSTR